MCQFVHKAVLFLKEKNESKQISHYISYVKQIIAQTPSSAPSYRSANAMKPVESVQGIR